MAFTCRLCSECTKKPAMKNSPLCYNCNDNGTQYSCIDDADKKTREEQKLSDHFYDTYKTKKPNTIVHHGFSEISTCTCGYGKKCETCMDTYLKTPYVSKHPVIVQKQTCKYWPDNCKFGNKCKFDHPVVQKQTCKYWPNCKFGDKCVNEHPKCECCKDEPIFQNNRCKGCYLATLLGHQ